MKKKQKESVEVKEKWKNTKLVVMIVDTPSFLKMQITVFIIIQLAGEQKNALNVTTAFVMVKQQTK